MASECARPIVKMRMRPSHEIYARIKWDPTLNEDDVVIGYEDRFKGIMEMSFAAFADPLSEVPFHRIRHFRLGDEVLWDRPTRLDVISEGYHPPDQVPEEPRNDADNSARRRSQSQKRAFLKDRRQARLLNEKNTLLEEDRRNDEIEREQAAQLQALHEQIERAQQRIVEQRGPAISPYS